MQHLHPYFHDDHPVRLDEMTYKDIVADITNNNVPGAIVNNLPYRDWAPLIRYVKYQKRKGDILQFFVPNRLNGWFSYIRYNQWLAVAQDHELNAVEAARILLWGSDLSVHCTCPSYLFWGHQYVATQLDMAIRPEERYPSIRNPQLKGTGLCKHLRRVIRVLPFHLGTMAREIKATRNNGKKV